MDSGNIQIFSCESLHFELTLTRPFIENNVLPSHVVTSLENPAERTKLATWVDKMKNSNPAKLAILAAIIGIAYYLWPK
jgi:hypothetical protein